MHVYMRCNTTNVRAVGWIVMEVSRRSNYSSCLFSLYISSLSFSDSFPCSLDMIRMTKFKLKPRAAQKKKHEINSRSQFYSILVSSRTPRQSKLDLLLLDLTKLYFSTQGASQQAMSGRNLCFHNFYSYREIPLEKKSYEQAQAHTSSHLLCLLT